MHLSPITNRKYKTSCSCIINLGDGTKLNNHIKLSFQLRPPMNHYQHSISLLTKSGLLTQTNKTRLTENIQNSSFNFSTLHEANNPTPAALHEQTHLFLNTKYCTSRLIFYNFNSTHFQLSSHNKKKIVTKPIIMNNKKRVQKLYISISHLPIIKSPSSNFLFDLTKTHEPQASIHIFMHLSFTEMYKTLNRKPAAASQDQLLMTLNSCFKRLFQGTTINALSICTHKIMLSHPLQRQTTGYSPLDVKKISKHKTSLHELHTRPPHKF